MRQKNLIILFIIVIVLVAGSAYFYVSNEQRKVNEKFADIDLKEQQVQGLISHFEDLINLEEPEPAKFKDIRLSQIPLSIPENLEMSIYAQGLGKPRDLEFGPNKTLMASVPSQGRIFAMLDSDLDGAPDEILTMSEDLNLPHGIAYKCFNNECRLFVAETGLLASYEIDPEDFTLYNKKELINLPEAGVHHTRSLLFLPPPDEHKLLISVGSSCDVCKEDDWRRAKILITNQDGSGFREFTSGLRNSVFMAHNPYTNSIWATEMGRDLLGDDLPPDEINIIEDGNDYGWPYCYGANVQDKIFDPRGAKGKCLDKSPAYIEIPAHSAPLGLAFFPSKGWPTEYWFDVVVAYHGSWNRSKPIGYKLVRHKFDESGNYEGAEDFISGWLKTDGTVMGRPVDIIFDESGVMYVSDDKSGVIYRVKYKF